MKNQQNNYGKAFMIPSILLLALTLWYKFSDSPMEKVLILMIIGTVIIPLTINIFTIVVGMAIKPISKEKRDVSNIINKPKEQPIHKMDSKELNKPKSKGKVNPSQYYIPFRDVISACSKNKLFTRDDILTLKSEIDYRLGNHKFVYDKNFTFENDLHEIYIKAKSSVLKDDDYQYLLQVVNDIVANNTEREEVQ